MTFLDNIRAIHNFYCINTNNLIEYSIFVENAQTMKKDIYFYFMEFIQRSCKRTKF